MKIGSAGFTILADNEYKLFKIRTDNQVQTIDDTNDTILSVERKLIHSTDVIKWSYEKAGKWIELPLYLDSEGEEVDLTTDYSQLTLPSDYVIWDTKTRVRAEMKDVDGYTYFDEITLYRLSDESGIQIVLSNEIGATQTSTSGDLNLQDLNFQYFVYNNKTLLVEGDGPNQFAVKHSFADGEMVKNDGGYTVSKMNNTFSLEQKIRLSFTVRVPGKTDTLKTSYFYIINGEDSREVYFSESNLTLVYDESGNSLTTSLSCGLVDSGTFLPTESYEVIVLESYGTDGLLERGADSWKYVVNAMTVDESEIVIKILSGQKYAIKSIPIRRQVKNAPSLTFSMSPSKLSFTYNSSKNIKEVQLEVKGKLQYGGKDLVGSELLENLSLVGEGGPQITVQKTEDLNFFISMSNSELVSSDKVSGYFANFSGVVKIKGYPETSISNQIPITLIQSSTVADELKDEIFNAIESENAEFDWAWEQADKIIDNKLAVESNRITAEINDRKQAVTDAIATAGNNAQEMIDDLAGDIATDFDAFNKAWADADTIINDKVTVESARITTEINDRKTAVANAISTANSNAQGFASTVQGNLDALGNASTTQKIHGNAMVTGTLGADKIISNSITAGQIKAGTITANLMAAESVVAGSLKVDQAFIDKLTVTDMLAKKITADALFATTVQTVTLNASKITTGILSADRIAVGSLSGDKIIARTITADKIKANSITSGQIDAASIKAVILTADSVTASTLKVDQALIDKLTVTNMLAKKITADSLFATTVQTVSLNADKITTGNLNADLIKVNTLKGDRILAGSISADKIKANSITSGQIDAASIKAVILTADAVVASTLKVDQALITKLTTGDLLTKSLTAKQAWITSANIVSLEASRIKGGTLQSTNGLLSWNLDNSYLRFSGASNAMEYVLGGSSVGIRFGDLYSKVLSKTVPTVSLYANAASTDASNIRIDLIAQEQQINIRGDRISLYDHDTSVHGFHVDTTHSSGGQPWDSSIRPFTAGQGSVGVGGYSFYEVKALNIVDVYTNYALPMNYSVNRTFSQTSSLDVVNSCNVTTFFVGNGETQLLNAEDDTIERASLAIDFTPLRLQRTTDARILFNEQNEMTLNTEIAILWKAVQELSEQNKKLQEQINELKGA